MVVLDPIIPGILFYRCLSKMYRRPNKPHCRPSHSPNNPPMVQFDSNRAVSHSHCKALLFLHRLGCFGAVTGSCPAPAAVSLASSAQFSSAAASSSYAEGL